MSLKRCCVWALVSRPMFRAETQSRAVWLRSEGSRGGGGSPSQWRVMSRQLSSCTRWDVPVAHRRHRGSWAGRLHGEGPGVPAGQGDLC